MPRSALFERFDERTRGDAGAFEDLTAGSSDAGWLVGCRLARPAFHTQVEDAEEGMDFLDWDAVDAIDASHERGSRHVAREPDTSARRK